jgi:phosphoribosylformimino-5-aminoimidazole carboxamide ribotide isomerase
MTAVHQEGRLQGPDLELMRAAAAVARVPLQASGGIRSLDDLRALSRIGIRGSVLGMSLYTQTLDPRLVAEEFGR